MIAPLLTLVAALSWTSPQTPATSLRDQKTAANAAAIEKLEAFTVEHPNDPKGWVILGLAYWDKDDYPRARAAFERAVKVGPESAEAHNWLGVALAEKADLPAAAAEFRKAVALDPKYGRAYSNLGSTLAQSGDYAEAVQVFRKALALEPNSVGAHLNLGTALRETGDLEGALEHLRRVAKADPDNPSVHYEVGQTLRQSGKLADAIAEFERALELDPEMREAYYALGTTLKQQGSAARTPDAPAASPGDEPFRRAQDALEQGDLARAREQLEEALRADERHADAHALLGFTLGQQGDLASAVPHLERAIALRPESASAHYHLGVALWYRGDKTRAIAELQRSVALDPAAGESYAFLGTALRDGSDWTGARRNLQRALALLPPTAAVYVDLGITFLRAGEFPKALGQLEAGLNAPGLSAPAPDWDGAIAALRSRLSESAGASAADPDKAEGYNILGRLLGQAGAPGADVAAAFREATRLRPAYPEAHNNLGLVLIQGGDDPNGIAALREAVRLDPNYAEAHANLGAALTPTDPDEAIRELERAVALAPNSVKALFNLATAYATRSNDGSSKAIEQLRKVIDLAPDFARAHLALGKALLQDGRVPDAIAALQEAARLEPASGEAHYQLGLALARAGRSDDAAAELKKGRELAAESDRAQNASLDIAEGRAAMDRGDLDEAAAKFRHAKTLQPDSSEVDRLLAAVSEKKAVPATPDTAPAEKKVVDDPKQVADIERDIRDQKFQQVEPRLVKYVEERPDSSWGWYALGYSLFAQQKIGPSIEALAKSLQLDITNAEAHKILGRNLMIIGRFDAAEIEFTQGLRYKPDSAELHYNLGKLFSIQDNWQRARTEFDAALRLDAGYIEALDGLGFALEALGEDEAAVATYEKAIALNTERHGAFVSAHVNLSAYYNRVGRADAALEYARKAIELDPKSDRAWFQKGRAEERQGDMTKAVESVNRAIALNQRASSYYYVLAGLYRRLGKMEESRKALESFSRLEKESSELDKLRRGGSAPAVPRDPQRE